MKVLRRCYLARGLRVAGVVQDCALDLKRGRIVIARRLLAFPCTVRELIKLVIRQARYYLRRPSKKRYALSWRPVRARPLRTAVTF